MINKKLIIFISLISLLVSCSSKNEKNDINLENVPIKINNFIPNILADEKLLYENLENISSNIRNYGSKGSFDTANYIKTILKNYGYDIEIQDFNIYEQDISTLNSESNWEYLELNPLNSEILEIGHNIIARQYNFDKDKKNIYITAHYDSTNSTSGVIDNATGTSTIIEVARILKDYIGEFNINFIFFDSEEYYRYGSKYFISTISENEIKEIIGAINIDMVGEKNAGDLIIQTPSVSENIMSIMLNNELKNELEVMVSGSSDDLSFYMGKIPAITLTDKNSNFNLDKESTEIQLQNVDISILKKTSELISNFIINLSLNTYNNLLKENMKAASMNSINDIPSIIKNINKFELIDIKTNLVANGYDKETQYIYENKDKNQFVIKERFGKFVPENYKSEFIKSTNDSNWYYKKIDDKVLFKGFNTSGEISGDISPDEALDILEQYYIYEYTSLFSEYPKTKLFK